MVHASYHGTEVSLLYTSSCMQVCTLGGLLLQKQTTAVWSMLLTLTLRPQVVLGHAMQHVSRPLSGLPILAAKTPRVNVPPVTVVNVAAVSARQHLVLSVLGHSAFQVLLVNC